MRSFLILSLALAACDSDSGLQHVSDRYGHGDGSLVGRVCDPTRYVWLEGASVYTHIIDEQGKLRDTRKTTSDVEGYWVLDDLDDGTYEVYIQYGSTTIDVFIATISDGRETEVPLEACTGSADVEVAVVTGDFDEFDEVLEAVGVGGYHLVNGQTGEELIQFLQNPVEMGLYDAIFFAGGHLEDGIFYSSDGSAQADVDAVQAALKDYVKAGGVVFASDWSYDVIEQTWPDSIDFLGGSAPDAAQIGEIGEIKCEVSSDNLEDELGKDTVEMNLDLDAWPVVDAAGDDTKVFLRADAPWRKGMETGEEKDSPMLLEFESGQGKVVYTPWRMSANLDGKAGKVVSWIIDREL
ncbi:MAG: carboxypeptidase regulatory-like domain-containing protein [Deltaproteobacteria bacterium]|nr:carboxypeptidase regulatory-like domain-containing protein [Deltaproteobacteria bacterium]